VTCCSQWGCDALASMCSTSGRWGAPCRLFRFFIVGDKALTCPWLVAEDNRAELLGNNGVETVVNAMNMFTWNEMVQCKACWVLSTLASTHGAPLCFRCVSTFG
jgi:hypothetical protein